MKFEFNFMWWDQLGRWVFNLTDGQNDGVQEIVAWLEDDIQGSSGARRMIDRLHRIQAGKEKKGYIGTGNAHSLLAFDSSLYLRCEFNDELKVILPVDEAITALEGFARFKSGDWENPNYQPECFVVAYNYEGAEAEARYAAAGLPEGLTTEEVLQNTQKLNNHRLKPVG